jgi:hypothetical protein
MISRLRNWSTGLGLLEAAGPSVFLGDSCAGGLDPAVSRTMVSANTATEATPPGFRREMWVKNAFMDGEYMSLS